MLRLPKLIRVFCQKSLTNSGSFHRAYPNRAYPYREITNGFTHTSWRRPRGWFIFEGRFPQQTSVQCKFAERDLKDEPSCGSSAACMWRICDMLCKFNAHMYTYQSCWAHAWVMSHMYMSHVSNCAHLQTCARTRTHRLRYAHIPSSQVSFCEAQTSPSPHTSIVHDEQPSQVSLLPSSHFSPKSTMPLPHSSIRHIALQLSPSSVLPAHVNDSCRMYE